MNFLKKSALAITVTVSIATGVLSLSASAATADFAKNSVSDGTRSTYSNVKTIYDYVPSVVRYTQKGITTRNEEFNCVNSNGNRITTNEVVNGITSKMTATAGYESNYKWCSVYLQDTEGAYMAVNTPLTGSTPNQGTISITNNSANNPLNGTIVNGYYVFNVNDGTTNSTSILSKVYLDVYLQT